ncbi:hypothetical protein, partial [Mesorhizobium sp. M2D.F.Ca.ET.178.01.1.1]|uniref:hypothetical protein n=1 Tax=Mesorhizobium sp. M2D.F.Ca.ET.178.01.1.1 TaxID=2563937 RepID=UPI001AEE036D
NPPAASSVETAQAEQPVAHEASVDADATTPVNAADETRDQANAADDEPVSEEAPAELAEPPEDDAEDEKDLARLDGEPGEAAEEPAAGQVTPPPVSGSLLD